ncbi:MAG TPA: M3 family metallopeptidase [Armatimonadota bacterium]|jgi:oligoendopeptidase F
MKPYFLLALALLPAARAQTFQSIPPEQAAGYHFNFRNFYASDAEFQKGMKRIDATVAEVRGLRGKVIASPQNLYKALDLSDDFTRRFVRAYFYLNLQYSVNTTQTGLRDKSADLDAKYSPQLSFVNDEIQKITMPQFERFVKAEPRLKKYRYVIEESLRSKPHTLSLKEEELLAATGPTMTKWQEDLYDRLMDRASWGTVKDPDTGGELDVRQDENRLANSPNRNVRRETNDKQTAAYKAQRDLFAFDFLNVASTRNRLGTIRKFRNGQDAAFFGLHLTYKDIDTAYNQILAHGDIRKRLQTLQRDRVASFTGYDTVHAWDMTMAPPGVEKPRFTIDQARAAILSSVAWLGPEYTREMARLLDPKNGRLDLVPGQNRVPNAFATPSPGFDAVFYSYGFQGYVDDVSTLAHEGGHVVHAALENNAKVPPALSDGPRYFTESYAILNEYVLLDKLYREEQDPGRKVYYLEQLLQRMMGFYGNVRIAAIEKAVYEQQPKGTLKTPDDLDKLTLDIGRKVSIWHEIDPETNLMWEQIPHYYGSPTYYVNYVFADLLAQTFFARYQDNPAKFGPQFTALLRNGFNDSPARLLKRFMNVSLTDPKTYDAVFQKHEQYLKDLEALYAKSPVQK